MHVLSMYLSHINGLSDVDPNVISSKYSMLANTGDSGEPKQNLMIRWSLAVFVVIEIKRLIISECSKN